MKLFLGWVVMLGVVATTFSSCGKDDPEPVPLIVGVWERDVYQLSKLPANYSNFNGYTLSSIYGDISYTLTVNADKTYSRRINRQGTTNINDNGTWTLEGDTFALKSSVNANLDEQFTVEDDITANDMILSQILGFSLLPNSVSDTLKAAWANAHPDELEQYFVDVDATVLFLFEK